MNMYKNTANTDYFMSCVACLPHKYLYQKYMRYRFSVFGILKNKYQVLDRC